MTTKKPTIHQKRHEFIRGQMLNRVTPFGLQSCRISQRLEIRAPSLDIWPWIVCPWKSILKRIWDYRHSYYIQEVLEHDLSGYELAYLSADLLIFSWFADFQFIFSWFSSYLMIFSWFDDFQLICWFSPDFQLICCFLADLPIFSWFPADLLISKLICCFLADLPIFSWFPDFQVIFWFSADFLFLTDFKGCFRSTYFEELMS